VSAPPMPQNPLELRIHIQNACESVDIQMLSNVFNEVDHLFLMHRITSGAYTDMRWQSKLWEFFFMFCIFHYCA